METKLTTDLQVTSSDLKSIPLKTESCHGADFVVTDD